MPAVCPPCALSSLAENELGHCVGGNVDQLILPFKDLFENR